MAVPQENKLPQLGDAESRSILEQLGVSEETAAIALVAKSLEEAIERNEQVLSTGVNDFEQSRDAMDMRALTTAVKRLIPKKQGELPAKLQTKSSVRTNIVLAQFANSYTGTGSTEQKTKWQEWLQERARIRAKIEQISTILTEASAGLVTVIHTPDTSQGGNQDYGEYYLSLDMGQLQLQIAAVKARAEAADALAAATQVAAEPKAEVAPVLPATLPEVSGTAGAAGGPQQHEDAVQADEHVSDSGRVGLLDDESTVTTADHLQLMAAAEQVPIAGPETPRSKETRYSLHLQTAGNSIESPREGKANEDAFAIGIEITSNTDGPVQIDLVADGVTSLKGGGLAKFVVDQYSQFFRQNKAVTTHLDDYVSKATAFVSAQVAESEFRGQKTATTLLLTVRTRDQLITYHAGDSRAYVAQNGQLEQITSDHSAVRSMIDAGQISPQTATTHPRRHEISHYISSEVPIELTRTPAFGAEPILLAPGAQVLLMTDGLSDMFVGADGRSLSYDGANDPEVLGIINTDMNVGEKVQQLLALAVRRGHTDDVTVVINKEQGSASLVRQQRKEAQSEQPETLLLEDVLAPILEEHLQENEVFVSQKEAGPISIPGDKKSLEFRELGIKISRNDLVNVRPREVRTQPDPHGNTQSLFALIMPETLSFKQMWQQRSISGKKYAMLFTRNTLIALADSLGLPTLRPQD